MSDQLQALYEHIIDSLSYDAAYQKKRAALAQAKLALIQELERTCGIEYTCYLDAYSSLEGEAQELRERALVQSALQLGLDLGRPLS